MTDSAKEVLQAASRLLLQEFHELKASNPHYGERGAEAEEILKTFLRDRLPRRFAVESGFILAQDGSISSHCDILVYDALNAPLYRASKRASIIPRDNVAAVIEVKSTLDKRELTESASKLASIKSLAASPLSNTDKPVNFAPIVLDKPFTCVFAYGSSTSLDALAENLVEILKTTHSDQWLDMVLVLDKGTLSLAVQFPHTSGFAGTFGGSAATPKGKAILPPPVYVHLSKQETDQLALNQFFVSLLSHLNFFRQKTSVDFESILGPDRKAMSIEAFQYKVDGSLEVIDESHRSEWKPTEPRYLIYLRGDRRLAGQVCYWSWKDGGVVSCSAPSSIRNQIFEHLHRSWKVDIASYPVGERMHNNHMTNVLPIDKPKFIAAIEKFRADGFFLVPDLGASGPPKTTFEGKAPSRR